MVVVAWHSLYSDPLHTMTSWQLQVGLGVICWHASEPQASAASRCHQQGACGSHVTLLLNLHELDTGHASVHHQLRAASCLHRQMLLKAVCACTLALRCRVCGWVWVWMGGGSCLCASCL